MLGGIGRASYYPGSLRGSGSSEERRIMRALGLNKREVPLDLCYLPVACVLTIAVQLATVHILGPAASVTGDGATASPASVLAGSISAIP